MQKFHERMVIITLTDTTSPFFLSYLPREKGSFPTALGNTQPTNRNNSRLFHGRKKIGPLYMSSRSVYCLSRFVCCHEVRLPKFRLSSSLNVIPPSPPLFQSNLLNAGKWDRNVWSVIALLHAWPGPKAVSI